MKSEVFINKNFFLIWLGKIISQLGDKFYAIALAWWILQKTNSPSIMGLFLLISVMPGLVLGFYAGAIVDRWNRKKILIASDILRGILVLLISSLSAANIIEVWQVFIIGAAISLVTAFFDPAIQAIIPQIVEEDELPKANGMSQLIGGICTVTGPMLGAVAVSAIGLSNVFMLNAVSYFLSALFSGLIVYKEDNRRNDNNKNVWLDMREGIAFLKNQKRVVIVIIIIAIAHFFVGSLMVLLPFLAKSLKGNGIQNLGYMEMILGLGLILGSIYISTKKKNKMKESHLIGFIMIVGVCFIGISLEKFLRINIVLPYMLVILIIGTAIAFASVFWQTLLQNNTPSHMTGKVFSVSTLAGNISLPIAYGIFGFLLNYNSIMKLMLFCGISLIMFSCIILLIVLSKKNNYLDIT